ncbi:MAG: hypothetical protein KC646_12225 [Candidatus Cloacimonetes bacterium]|nr:hypothetical protein [Candidatus Cloacimonadota bacterium]
MLRILKVILFLLIVLNLVFMVLFINASDDSDKEFDVAQIEVTADLEHVFSKSKNSKGLLAINKESVANRKSDELQKQIDLATQQSQMNRLQGEIISSSIEETISSSEVNASNFVGTPTSIEFDTIQSPKELIEEKAKLLKLANKKASLRKKALFAKIDQDEEDKKISIANEAKKIDLAKKVAAKEAKEKLEQAELVAEQKAYELAKKRAKAKIRKAQELARIKIAKELDRIAQEAKIKDLAEQKAIQEAKKKADEEKLRLSRAMAKKAAEEKLKQEKQLVLKQAQEQQRLARLKEQKQKAQELKKAEDLARVKAAEKLAMQVKQAKLKAQADLKAVQLAKQKVAEEKRKINVAMAKKAAEEKLKQEKQLALKQGQEQQRLARLKEQKQKAQELKKAKDLARLKAAEKLAMQVKQAKRKAQADLKAIQETRLKVAAQKRKLNRARAKKIAEDRLKLALDLAKKQAQEKQKLEQEQARKEEAAKLKIAQDLAREREVERSSQKAEQSKRSSFSQLKKKDFSSETSRSRLSNKTKESNKIIKVEHVIYNPNKLSLDGEVTLQWINRSVLKIKYPKKWVTLITGDELSQDHIELWMDIDGINPPQSYGDISYQIGIGLSKNPWIKNFLKTKKKVNLKATTLSYGDVNEILVSNIPRDLRAYNVVFSKSSLDKMSSQAVLLSASKTFKWGNRKTLLLKH